jgi:hypothetical protein
MQTILLNNFSHLPLELINLILKYLNVISYRNGKYIDKIMDHDKRYDIIRRIQRPIKISSNQYYVGLRSLNKIRIIISINYVIYDNNILISVSANKYINATICFVIGNVFI